MHVSPKGQWVPTLFDVLGEKVAGEDIMKRHDNPREPRGWLIPKQLFMHNIAEFLGKD
jgi:hypothetical protein